MEELHDQFIQLSGYTRQLEIENSELRQENLQLRQYREQGFTGTSFVKARTTASSNDPLNPILTIDKGSSKGITKDMVVSWSFNLVGVVTHAYPMSSDVRLINNADATLPVKFGSPNALHSALTTEEYILRLYEDEDRNTFYTDIDVETPLTAGDWAYFSDQRNGYWPPEASGHIVGEVARIEEHPTDPFIYKRVIVKPRIDLSRLRKVWVIIPGTDME